MKSNILKVELSMVKIGELLRKLWSLRSFFNILPPGALTSQGIEGAMKRDVSKHWCTLQWCASWGWFIAHENWTSWCDLEIWRITLKNNRAPLLSNIKLLCFISSSYVNSNWSYSPETAKLGYDLCDLDRWPLTLTFCMDITSVISNNSWKFRDDTVMGT